MEYDDTIYHWLQRDLFMADIQDSAACSDFIWWTEATIWIFEHADCWRSDYNLVYWISSRKMKKAEQDGPPNDAQFGSFRGFPV